MALNILITILAKILFSECAAQQWCEDQGGSADLRPVNYPTACAIKFPQEQVIKKQLRATTQWQSITFEKPLQINREGLMGLHLVVDRAPYISFLSDHSPDPECDPPECALNTACLRRLSDCAIVSPEIVLVGDNGVEARVRPCGHLCPSFDQHVMTVTLRYFKNGLAFASPFPRDVKAFTAMRIRSTKSFLVRYLWWKVDNHPYFYPLGEKKLCESGGTP